MEKITYSQKILFMILCGLLILMVIFSIYSLKHRGQKGFDACIQKKCEEGGEYYCSKYREINNCCLGSGGQTAQEQDGNVICIFN